MIVLRLSSTDVIDTARGIVTGELLVADLSNTAWQVSLALMLDAIRESDDADQVGALLVPKSAHLAMPWIDNTAPGVTVSCRPIHVDDLPALEDEVERMHHALNPEPPCDAP